MAAPQDAQEGRKRARSLYWTWRARCGVSGMSAAWCQSPWQLGKHARKSKVRYKTLFKCLMYSDTLFEGISIYLYWLSTLAFDSNGVSFQARRGIPALELVGHILWRTSHIEHFCAPWLIKKRWVYLSLNSFLTLFLYQMSTCTGLSALDHANSKFSRGYATTGVGVGMCMRHEFIQKNRVGDLQKGERWAKSWYVNATN